MMLVLMLTASTFMMARFDSRSIEVERNIKTADALMEAKKALIAFAQNQYLNSGNCTSQSNCPRPGDLPCPDLNNDGESESSCGNAAGTSGQVKRVGRFPWKTLGVGDLRDGYNERLWYAVSNNYKNNTRKLPLNIHTFGTISLRDVSGKIIFDGSNDTGLVALLISAGPPIKSQKRELADQFDVTNYLDESLVESNTSFVDGTQNGFISGPIKDLKNNLLVNDVFLEIKSDEIDIIIKKTVFQYVAGELLNYYCGSENFEKLLSECVKYGLEHRKFPSPANIEDLTCFKEDIKTPECSENVNLINGIFPGSPNPYWESNSILRGIKSGNWFQQNRWRGLINYSISEECKQKNSKCNVEYSIKNGYVIVNHEQ
jgi:hypothetical protein